MDGIASHLEVTVRVALQTGLLWPESGILELGCGDYSTPILAAIAQAQGRGMVNIVSDLNWAARFRHCRTTFREIKFGDWPGSYFDGHFGMCLMDNEQAIVDRFENLKRLSLADVGVVVCHDCIQAVASGCRWDDMGPYFKHVILLGRRYPETPGTLEDINVSLLSNRVDPAPWFHPGQVKVIA